MIFYRLNIAWRKIFKVFLSSITIVLFLFSLVSAYSIGVLQGYRMGQSDTESDYLTFLEDLAPIQPPLPSLSPIPTHAPTPSEQVANVQSSTWGGPDLWEAVNKKRVEFGVNALRQKDELCTVASIRLNELLELGKLDAHEGFGNFEEQRPDLAWIFSEYSTIAEFLALGGQSAQETVSLWENTLGHIKLLNAGEYVWGCIYAQNNIAVAITAF